MIYLVQIIEAWGASKGGNRDSGWVASHWTSGAYRNCITAIAGYYITLFQNRCAGHIEGSEPRQRGGGLSKRTNTLSFSMSEPLVILPILLF